MPSLQSLDDGQRAILQLLLKQGKSYDELAQLLGTDPTGVRQRAREAVAALGPVSAGVGHDRRDEIADYLLGQQTALQRAATREFLAGSAAARIWARPAATALRPLAPGGLPDLPGEPAVVEQAVDALDRGATRRQRLMRDPRMRGRLLFGGLGLVLALGLLWALGAFDGSDGGPSANATSTVTTETATTFEPLQTAVMKAPKARKSKAEAVAVIARPVGSEDLSLALRAIEVAPSSAPGAAYGVWLYSSPSSARLVGLSTRPVGKDGVLEVAFQLAKDTPNFKEALLTRETVDKPARPGAIVLRGPLTIVPAEARGQGAQTQPPPG